MGLGVGGAWWGMVGGAWSAGSSSKQVIAVIIAARLSKAMP